MKDRNIGFGIFIITIGVVFLLINFGVISWSIIETFLEYWPAILIVIGVNIIFKHNQIVRIVTWLLYLAAMIVLTYYYSNTNYYTDFHWAGSFAGFMGMIC